MKLAALCPTYGRPELLANAVACFLAQDYPADKRELIVLDDAGQYLALDVLLPPGVKLMVTTSRFRTLGEKRNATAALAWDADAYCVWDDDDAYLPNHMSLAAEALSRASSGMGLVIPPRVLVEGSRGGQLVEKLTGGIYHGGWSFHRRLFEHVRGYPFIQSGQDQAFKALCVAAKCHVVQPLGGGVSYVYRWGSWPHVSQRGVNYEGMPEPVGPRPFPEPEFQRDWVAAVREARPLLSPCAPGRS